MLLFLTQGSCDKRPRPSHIHLDGLKFGQCSSSTAVSGGDSRGYPPPLKMLLSLLTLIPILHIAGSFRLFTLPFRPHLLRQVFADDLAKKTSSTDVVSSPYFVFYIFLFIHLLSCIFSVFFHSCKLWEAESLIYHCISSAWNSTGPYKVLRFYMTQQSHFWAYTPRKPDLKETRAPQCSLQHCLS